VAPHHLAAEFAEALDEQPLVLALLEHVQVRVRRHSSPERAEDDPREGPVCEAGANGCRDRRLGEHAVDHPELVVDLHRSGLQHERSRLASRLALVVDDDRVDSEPGETDREQKTRGSGTGDDDVGLYALRHVTRPP
jgi:hypothetical protein